ncbi:MAG: bifunctional transaldolase/phosoglucose isomerase [Anaerolineales bacterium]
MTERLKELSTLGQSIWYDNIQRSMLTSGELDRLIASGVRGMTSNPSIFNQAISESNDYDSSLEELFAAGLEPDSIYEKLVLEDITSAADQLRKVYERTGGLDGYVSLEVRPTLAMDTAGTISEARHLFRTLDRPNIMIKVPATLQGIPAIKTLIAEGVNINITLIFSIKRYEAVAEAYISGLEQCLAGGGDISRIASVASFFVSRVDTKVDRELEKIGNSSLKGKIGIANSKLAYQRFLQIFHGERWERLQSAGARVQRPLWASTSTKNPSYPDTLYVDNLIGPNTVNTVPPATLEAFIDHGKIGLTLEKETGLAFTQLEQLDSLEIDFDQITQELEEEGVEAFKNSFLSLLDNLTKKRNQLQTDHIDLDVNLNDYQNTVDQALREITNDDVIKRIREHDFTLWKPDPTEITNRLGWLDIAQRMKSALPELDNFISDIRHAGFTQALLLGMGGSSLAPEVFRKTFGVHEGYLDLAVLDSTDPGAISALVGSLDLEKTLFIVSTKSGGTTETLSFFKYFYNRISANRNGRGVGSQFIAITDADSKLDEIASRYHFRRTFHNDPNIGGRYSALSYFGLVPAALIGIDLGDLLDQAIRIDDDQAAYLGAILGELAIEGRDKLTLLISPEISSFGDWVEQLIAESTGKEGKGILPVVGEPLNQANYYAEDRLFVSLKYKHDATYDGFLSDLEQAGHPVLRMQLDDLYEMGKQFILWELATAVTGTCLQINPFNQPNVESAKVLARKMVSTYQEKGKLPDLEGARGFEEITIYPDFAETLEGCVSARQVVDRFLADAKPGAYVSIQAYIQPTEEANRALQLLRRQLRDQTLLATTIGYGPRFLHSTGQLHKGDRGLGMFIQLISDAHTDIPIPDEPGNEKSGISFGVLKQAQALGDRLALLDSGRRVLRLNLGQDPVGGIKKLLTPED